MKVGIDASRKSFKVYKSGIYFDPEATGKIDHAVTAVGFGSDGPGQDYYIVILISYNKLIFYKLIYVC